MKAEPCKFFAKGHCARGSKCFYSHSNTAEEKDPVLNGPQVGNWRLAAEHKRQPHLRPEANEFAPAHQAEKNTARSLFVPCRFFAQGLCKNGASCTYQHVLSPETRYADDAVVAQTTPRNVRPKTFQMQSLANTYRHLHPHSSR